MYEQSLVLGALNIPYPQAFMPQSKLLNWVNIIVNKIIGNTTLGFSSKQLAVKFKYCNFIYLWGSSYTFIIKKPHNQVVVSIKLFIAKYFQITMPN